MAGTPYKYYKVTQIVKARNKGDALRLVGQKKRRGVDAELVNTVETDRVSASEAKV